MDTNSACKASEQEKQIMETEKWRKNCNNAEGNQNPQKQPALAVDKQSNGKSLYGGPLKRRWNPIRPFILNTERRNRV